MPGLARKGETEIECPFCHKGKVKMFHKEGHLQPKFSRIAAKSAVTYYRSPDIYNVLEDCPNCGKTKKEIEDVLEGKKPVKEMSHEERLKRIKEAGLPTKIEELIIWI